MPQKDKVKRHKKTKRNATKRQSEMPQKDKVSCSYHILLVSLHRN